MRDRLGNRVILWCINKEFFLIVAIMLAGLTVRFYGINFGLPYLYNTDEAWQVNYALAFGKTWDLTLYPSYPPLLMYLLFFLYGIYFVIGFLIGTFNSMEDFAIQFFKDSTMIYLIGRSFIALTSTASIYVLYLLGSKIYNRKVGLVSALFLTFSFTHVEYSHYIKSHGLLASFAIISIFFIYKMWESGRYRDYILAGLFSGLSVGVLQPGAFLVIPLFLAHVFRVFNNRKGWLGIFSRPSLVCIVFWIFGVVVSNPVLLLNINHAVEFSTMAGKNMANFAGSMGSPFYGHIFLLSQSMGILLVILSVGGIAYALWRHSQKELLLASFPVIYLLFFSMYRAKVDYHVLPTHPFLALLGALFLVDMVFKIRISERLKSIVLLILALVIILPSALAVFSWDYRISQKDTRTTAKEWIEQNIPAGSKILMDSGKYYTSMVGPPLKDSRENLKEKYQVSIEVDPQNIGKWVFGRRVHHPYASDFYRYSLAATSGITYNLTRITHDMFSPIIEIQPLQFYQDLGIQYVIVSKSSYSAYYSSNHPTPTKAAAYRSFYNSLEEQAFLLKEFPSSPDRPGPTIKIYKLNGK